MLDELAKAVDGTVFSDSIYTDKGSIRCAINGTVWLSNRNRSVNLGKIGNTVAVLAAAYKRAP